jgi:hypothetical protein
VEPLLPLPLLPEPVLLEPVLLDPLLPEPVLLLDPPVEVELGGAVVGGAW